MQHQQILPKSSYVKLRRGVLRTQLSCKGSYIKWIAPLLPSSENSLSLTAGIILYLESSDGHLEQKGNLGQIDNTLVATEYLGT